MSIEQSLTVIAISLAAPCLLIPFLIAVYIVLAAIETYERRRSRHQAESRRAGRKDIDG